MKAHFQHAQKTAPGLAIPVEAASSFAATQAAWRFFGNERISPQQLIEPLRQFARQQIAPHDYVLSVVDWSKIDYRKHTAKTDVVQLTHKTDVGYESTTQLLVDANNGLPIAPFQMHLKTADGLLSTMKTFPENVHHLEQIFPMMNAITEANVSKKIVHIIDREADSVWHYRQWSQAGHQFLIRGDSRRVTWRGSLTMYEPIVEQLECENAFRRSREVTIKGKKGIQEVAKTKVLLTQPAKRQGVEIPGVALELRLVIVRVRSLETGELLSTWYLLTNVDEEVSAEQIALWYYWRWNIESYFKLMKSAGLELEHWQQESGEAIFKRLLVASMAAALVWNLQQLESPEATELKDTLIRMSGKSVKRSKPYTSGALLSGLFVLLRLFDFLDEMDYDTGKLLGLRNILKTVAPNLLE